MVFSVSRCAKGFCHAEVDDLDRLLAVLHRNQDVGGLQVAVNDGLVVGVLHPLAHPHEQLEALPRGQPVVVAVFRDRHARHVLHDEVRRPLRGGPGVEDPRDRGMVHQRQGLPFGLEARDHRLARHAGLDQLDGHRAVHRRSLLTPPDLGHAAFADFLQQPVRTDHGPRGRKRTQAYGRLGGSCGSA